MHNHLSVTSTKEELWEEIQRLRRLYEKQQEELKRKDKEFKDYKKRHPETVGVKHGKAYEIKKPKRQPAADPPKDKKKPGGQPGHPGHHRPQPDRIDHEVEVNLEQCPNGSSHHLSEVQETRCHTVEDAPEPQSVVTRYHIQRRYCRDCKKLVEPNVPGVLLGALIGLRAMLIVAWLRIGMRLPQDNVPPVLEALAGVRISSGEVQNILDQLAIAYGPFYFSLLGEVRKARAKYVDETTWSTNKRNQYMWAFITKWEAIFKISDTRGHENPLEVLGENATGTIISDGFSGYNTLVRKTRMDHQRCWTHVLGDAKEVAEFRPEEGQPIAQGLKSIYARAVGFEGEGTDEDVAVLKDAMVALLDQPFTSHKVASFARNTLKVADQLLWFVAHPEVEGTNNRAERALRPSVTARKISGGSRSVKGANVRSILTSVFTTLKLRDIDLLSGVGLAAGRDWNGGKGGKGPPVGG